MIKQIDAAAALSRMTGKSEFKPPNLSPYCTSFVDFLGFGSKIEQHSGTAAPRQASIIFLSNFDKSLIKI